MQFEVSLFRVRREFFFNLAPALRGAHHDTVGPELPLVVRKIAHTNRRCAQEPVSSRYLSGSDPTIGKLKRPAIEHRHHPANRPDETRTLKAGPSHGARPGQVVNRP